MTRLLPLLLLGACLPVIADVSPVDPADPPVVDPDCDATFAVDRSWSVAVDDYGMIRGADAFDAAGETFVHAGGAYQTITRTYEVATGRVLSADTAQDRQLLVRDAASDTDVVFTQGTLEILRTSTGRRRAVLSDISPGWLAPALALDGETLALARCDDTERAAVSAFDLDGEHLQTVDLARFCQPWNTASFDFDEARQAAVIGGGAQGLLVRMADGVAVELTAHEPGSNDIPMAGIVHDVAFSPDGRLVATAGLDGRLLVHLTDSGELVAERPVRVTQVNQNIYATPDTRSPFAWSPDGALLARGLDDDTIVVERVCDGQILDTLDIDPTLNPPFVDEGAAPATLHFSPDGRSLVAVYEGGVQGFVGATR
jgi:WD40 repeat protein